MRRAVVALTAVTFRRSGNRRRSAVVPAVPRPGLILRRFPSPFTSSSLPDAPISPAFCPCRFHVSVSILFGERVTRNDVTLGAECERVSGRFSLNGRGSVTSNRGDRRPTPATSPSETVGCAPGDTLVGRAYLAARAEFPIQLVGRLPHQL